ncbi:MAG: hypothetical protein JSS07_02945 [Proteobacteria bacterium]|nr:hypothetical protein [Pseudomonadota bacterium]
MAIPKKASTKKVVTKKPAAKKTKLKAQATKKNVPKKRTKAKSKSEATILNQQFENSLDKLISYWEKQVKLLTKQLNSHQTKLEKSLSKQKSNPSAKQLEKQKMMQDEMDNAHQALVSATQGATKFTALRTHIAQFESEWLAQIADPVEDDADTLSTNNHHINTSKHNKPLTQQQEKRDWEEESAEEMVEELEDIFMPQEDLSEFEVTEDFSVTSDEDLFEDEDN